MKQNVVPEITSVGKIWGRDAIFLDEVKVLNESTFILIGEFNGNLCENLTDGTDQKFQVTFKAVHLFKMIELDFDEIEYQSSFDRIENSEQIAEMVRVDTDQHIGKIDFNFQHFVFRTYDTVFEVIGKEYELKLI
ncbi:hypothetical protein PZB74_18740 [Porifericola rhodea]|uniref:hypothetical protein n=1 Tax=Porifericola rhodea TaxID=930972 RepID=UPI00266570DF|nr:hypothetical protein [Porifericola rhodea]WKN30990.1 hypothetical protein PZB74_18740 [Porifericola rhodea]